MSRLQQVINSQKQLNGSRIEHRTAETLKEISKTLAMLYDKLDQMFPEQKKEDRGNEQMQILRSRNYLD